MFCPTALDEFFIQKLSSLDLSINKGSLSKGSLNESRFQDRITFKERLKEAEEAKRRYPSKIPVVIEMHKTEKTLQEIDKVGQDDLN